MMPGMIDAHVHMMTEFKPLEERLTTPFSYNFYAATEYLKRTLNAGVTSVRDALGSDLGLKKAIDDGLVNGRSEEHTSELQSRGHLVCRLLLEKKKDILMVSLNTAQ